MIETDANRQKRGLTRIGVPSNKDPHPGDLALGRVTKGVATALGKTLTVDRDAALPDCLATLVERLQEGPLGQPNFKSLRVA